MPSFCAVIGCSSKSNRDKVSFFSFPSECLRGSGRRDPLAALRRQKWISALRREGLTPTILRHQRICSRHFISGRPSELRDHNNPDWIPSVNMGYKNPSNHSSRLSRHGRASKRLKRDLPSTSVTDPSIPLRVTSSEEADAVEPIEISEPFSKKKSVQNEPSMLSMDASPSCSNSEEPVNEESKAPGVFSLGLDLEKLMSDPSSCFMQVFSNYVLMQQNDDFKLCLHLFHEMQFLRSEGVKKDFQKYIQRGLLDAFERDLLLP